MTVSRIVPAGGSTGQVLSKVDGADHNVEWETPGAGAGITELTGDATAGPGTGAQAVVVVAIQGQAVHTAAPSNGDVLTWNNGSTRWEAAAPGGGGLNNYDVRKRAIVLTRGGR
jgi:hypothetical protein